LVKAAKNGNLIPFNQFFPDFECQQASIVNNTMKLFSPPLRQNKLELKVYQWWTLAKAWRKVFLTLVAEANYIKLFAL
jgi:hypothetical protein